MPNTFAKGEAARVGSKREGIKCLFLSGTKRFLGLLIILDLACRRNKDVEALAGSSFSTVRSNQPVVGTVFPCFEKIICSNIRYRKENVISAWPL